MSNVKLKRNEHEQADHIENAVVYLAASNYTPVTKEYSLASSFHPSQLDMDWMNDLFKKVNKTNEKGVTPFIINEHIYLGSVMQPVVGIPGLIATACKLLPLNDSSNVNKVHLVSARIKPDGNVNRYIPTTLSTRCPAGFPVSEKEKQGYRAWYPSKSQFADRTATGMDQLLFLDVIDTSWKMICAAWSVSFSIGSGPGVRVLACAESLKGMFAMRDKPDGMTRRQALRHWVKEHKRTRPDATECDVRRHLRGRDEFEWFGMSCRIHAAMTMPDSGGTPPNDVVGSAG